MRITKHNIHKHELIGLKAQIAGSDDKRWIGLSGRIVDETKNTFRMDISGREKIIQKKGTILALTIGNDEVVIDASLLRIRPEDRIKKAKKRAVT
jgi:ribonuclease P protein subunit POP4